MRRSVTLAFRAAALIGGAVMFGGAALSAMAQDTAKGQTIIEDFTMQPNTRWRFFTDQVMGGVSTGGVVFAQDGDKSFARMTGRVSTENQGGFIQMRLDLAGPPPEGTTGVRLVVRGNAQRYFVHLRTEGTILPWQYYQAQFEVTENWQEIRLPLDSFAASGGFLRDVPSRSSLTSLGIVAYGRDHDAQIDVAEVGFF